jgi:hypothetical protein
MRVEMGDVDAPRQRAIDLGAALGAHVLFFHSRDGGRGRSREVTVIVVQRGPSGERTPSVAGVFGGQRQMHPNGQAFEHPCGRARVRAGDHERRAGRHAVCHRLERCDVGGVADAEVVAVDDQKPVVGAVAQAFGEALLRHGRPSFG